jgi:hypothetical protein
VTHDFFYINSQDEVVALQRGTWINAERHATKERSAERTPVTFDPYPDDQLAEVDSLYDGETRRGADIRYFEDVEVGEELQPRVKGPLVVTDLIVWHLGRGMQPTPGCLCHCTPDPPQGARPVPAELTQRSRHSPAAPLGP